MSIAPGDLTFLNFLVEDKKPGTVPMGPLLGRALRALRAYLHVDIAYISEAADGGSVIRHIDTRSEYPGLVPGGRDPFDHAECGADNARAGAHICVPIQLDGGTRYGNLVCAGPRADAVLHGRDVSMVRVFAELAAEHIEADMYAQRRTAEIEERVRFAIDSDLVSFLYQPVYDIKRAAVVGFEALARFAGTPPRGPGEWFADAARVGMDVALEAKLIAKAMESFQRLPDAVYIGFNVSPNIIVNGQLERAFANAPLERIVLEINEHPTIRQYDEMAKVLAPLREHGLRISVDEAGGGIESFRHILQLKPDIIKLHMSLVRGIHTDHARSTLASALIQFGKEHRCDLVAEGIETAAELSKLKAMGVAKMQGYLLGRPGTLEAACMLCEKNLARRAVQPGRLAAEQASAA
ncbi:MAG TPA: EAL domain-containing protein [Burkholderiales bacterium]|nr:EAL domain-containing protein [Burkholderiales bacterium]